MPTAPRASQILLCGLEMFVLVTACQAVEVGKADTLLAAISAQNLDGTVATLNEIKRSRYRGDVLPMVKALWNNERDKYPNIPWPFVNLDIVRVNLADILLQADRNKEIEIDKRAIHTYVRKVAFDSTDMQAKAAALLALGVVDDPQDVAALQLVALAQRDPAATSAILALGMMCNNEAGTSLEGLPAKLKNERLADMANKARKMYSDSHRGQISPCSRH